MLSRGYEFYLRGSERSELVRYRVENEKIKFVSTSEHVIFCLLYTRSYTSHYIHTDGEVL